jgi:hypothetical protein
VKRLALFSCFVLALAAACGNDDEGHTSTHEVVDPTIKGLCSKLDSLECAQPNCEEQFDYTVRHCDPDAVQDLLDCLAIATFQCKDATGDDRVIPRTQMCEHELEALVPCSS